MTITELKQKKEYLENALKQTHGSDKFARAIRKAVKEDIDKLDMMIFKAEAPEQFENYKQALQGYIDNTHYGI